MNFKFLIWAIVLIFSVFGSAYSRISARIEYACFPAESGGGRILLVFGIDGNSLTYKRLPDNAFRASATFAISINNSVHNFFAERMDFETPAIND